MKIIIREQMKTILVGKYNGKPVWKAISDGELTSAPSFKGELYDEASVKIMYVGHAVNGWEEKSILGHSNLDDTLDAIMAQTGAFASFIKKEGYPYITQNGNERVYRHINSNFLRLIKEILEYQGESDFPTTEDSWYKDSKNWQKKFVWSNLYKIAPRNGGNPDNQIIKPYMNQYTEIIKAEIEMYKPDVVIFCPLKGAFVPWAKEKSFKDILDAYEDCDINNTIIGKGHLGSSKIIVCRRPDARGISREDVARMAKCISDYIDEVRRKKNDCF